MLFTLHFKRLYAQNSWVQLPPSSQHSNINNKVRILQNGIFVCKLNLFLFGSESQLAVLMHIWWLMSGV